MVLLSFLFRIINTVLKTKVKAEEYLEKLTGFKDDVRVEQCGSNMSPGIDICTLKCSLYFGFLWVLWPHHGGVHYICNLKTN